jgi:hypothetical protein
MDNVTGGEAISSPLVNLLSKSIVNRTVYS